MRDKPLRNKLSANVDRWGSVATHSMVCKNRQIQALFISRIMSRNVLILNKQDTGLHMDSYVFLSQNWHKQSAIKCLTMQYFVGLDGLGNIFAEIIR